MKNKETLEEVAEKLYPYNDGFQVMDIDISEELQLAFINGAKWQQQQMYSEEEVLNILKTFLYNSQMGKDVEDVKLWFEEFKKK